MSISSGKETLNAIADLKGEGTPKPVVPGNIRAIGVKIPVREYSAEFLGVLILVILGVGVNCQVGISTSSEVVVSFQAGNWVSIWLGWATGVALGIWVSGGHINPAITLVMAVHRGFPLRKVPGYLAAQITGGLVGAAIMYANYVHGINIVEGGLGIRTLRTARYFGTYALPYMTDASAFFSEFVATAIFTFGVLAVTDKRSSMPLGIAPFALFIVTAGVGMGLGRETSFALNPARDLGPRLLTAMAGYGKEVFVFRSHYWIWCPILATILGAQFAAIVYDIVAASVDTGSETGTD